MYEKYCPHCKTALSSFYNTGMLGCPNCYVAFEPEIKRALQKIQGTTVHVGKKLVVDEYERRLLLDYKRLEKEMKIARSELRFADALNIEQELGAIEDELKRRGLL